jgi:hypothetical protein
MKGHVGGGPWLRAYKGSGVMVKTRLLYVYHNALPTFGSELSDWFCRLGRSLNGVSLIARLSGSVGGGTSDMNLRV